MRMGVNRSGGSKAIGGSVLRRGAAVLAGPVIVTGGVKVASPGRLLAVGGKVVRILARPRRI